MERQCDLWRYERYVWWRGDEGGHIMRKIILDIEEIKDGRGNVCLAMVSVSSTRWNGCVCGKGRMEGSIGCVDERVVPVMIGGAVRFDACR